MSQKTKRSAASTPVPMQSSTPVQGGSVAGATHHHTGRPTSPLSPTRLSRIQEKVDLQNLNDRLACYIDRVRFLEQENSRLTMEVRTSQETVTREVSNIKSMYEHELSDARKLLDETAREKAKLEIDAKRIWEENDDLKKRLERKTKEAADAERNARAQESRANEVSGKYTTLLSEHKKAKEEQKELEKEVARLKKQLDVVRKNLEEETLARVDLENTVQSLREELTFKDQVHQQELTETKTRRQVEISEIDGMLSEQYEAKLQQTLQDLRDQYDMQLRVNREEISDLYETRLRDLELQMNEERVRHAAEKSKLMDEVERLRKEISHQLQEYQDLMDIKISLDMEIAAYDKLLSSEEVRLNITPGSQTTIFSTSSSSSMARSSGPVRRTPSRAAAAKRKRTVLEESDERSVSDFSVTSSAKGDIEIVEVDPEGKYVKLHNKSSKEVQIGGWTLIRKVGANETAFKFHRSLKLDGGAFVTVWSSDLGKDHEPPSTIVMKGQKWFAGDNMSTQLLNSDGEEVAASERVKRVISTAASRHREYLGSYGGEELYHQQGEPKGDEKCRIM
ncbi:lamin Dm0 [Anopheles ziemanni]|uniref:lamin Dm0 n=1 Tax=Anopheles coustani TaxID=139045 RepID=UPI00265B3700|nr:lamin Dm0 [Anopheles coustani]XP_058175067.1 lamin Dm0 [Anopheles ziemanni]